MVFGSKRETKPDSLSREDVVGNLYPDSLTSEVDVAQPASEFPRTGDRGNESVIDPHARFNGKYVSDRDLRIEGEAQGEIECQGTLIISPQALREDGLIDEQDVVPGARQGRPGDTADGTGADDGDDHAPLSITGPGERQRDAPVDI